jgi:calcineurin-like phosphoesterase family protein
MINDMDAGLIENWNRLVKPGDTVYHLGDFCLTKRVDLIDHWLGQLNGEIRLIRGNHDQWTKRYERLEHKGKIKWIRDYAERKFVVDGAKYKFVLCHYPMLYWNHGGHGSIMLHGHSHGSADHHNLDVRRMDVGVDCHGWCPVLLENVITMMEDRGVNHHHEDAL